jgi:hypothetical protein
MNLSVERAGQGSEVAGKKFFRRIIIQGDHPFRTKPGGAERRVEHDS